MFEIKKACISQQMCRRCGIPHRLHITYTLD